MRLPRPNPYLLITVVSWAFNFIAVKEAYKQISPPAVALLRYLVMWGALVLVCLWRKESLRMPAEDRKALLWLGFMSMGVYMLLFLEGMHYSGATEGSILLQMSPIFTAILAAAFGQEKFSRGALVGAIIAFVGTAAVIYGGTAQPHGNTVIGNIVVFISAFTWAYSVTIMRPLLLKHSPLRVLTLSMAGGLPVMLVYGLLPTVRQDWGSVTLYGWAMFFHIAIVSGVIAFICFYEGVRKVGASGATLYQYLVPATTMLFGIFYTHQAPNIWQIAGLLVVLAGVGFATRARFLAQAAAR